jgi:hypothetical protein
MTVSAKSAKRKVPASESKAVAPVQQVMAEATAAMDAAIAAVKEKQRDCL